MSSHTSLRLALGVALLSACGTGSARMQRSAMAEAMNAYAPIHPSQRAATADAASLVAVRFAPEHIEVEDPALADYRSLRWEAEVQAYTAEVLNTAVGAAPDGPVAETAVRFQFFQRFRDMSPAVELIITVTSRLADGRSVRSEKWREVKSAGQQAWVTLGTLLGVLATGTGLGGLLTGELTGTSETNAVMAFTWGSLGAALLLTAGTIVAGVLADQDQEQRWSDTYQEVLLAHAAEVRRAVEKGP